jgi:ferritin-like protein
VDKDRGSVLQFFAYDHLPPELAQISKHFYELAHHLHDYLPHNSQSYMMLQKLLEAKDCAVRAALFQRL